MSFSTTEIESITQSAVAESGLRLWYKPEWKQDQTEYRTEIRKFAANFFDQAKLKKEILDLSKPLVRIDSPKPVYFSISHSTQAGILAQSRIPLGVDLESFHRINPKVVQRISAANEVAEAPSPGHLWTAKEATFKSLIHFRQPQTLSQIEIFQWQQIQNDTYQFRLKDPEKFAVQFNAGFVFLNHSEALAVFFANP